MLTHIANLQHLVAVPQAMVPMWDALNHVTGRANVRLHHCERSSTLQMIATADIGADEEVLSRLRLLKCQGALLVTLMMCRPPDVTEGHVMQLVYPYLTWPTTKAL